VCAHEIIHDVVQNEQSGFIFKLDYENSYDKVDREFLVQMMENRGFSPKWVFIVRSLLQNVSVGFRLNDENSNFVLSSRGFDGVTPSLSCCH
jgi:hypothetical protein